MSGIEPRKPATVVAIISSNYLLRLGLQRIVEGEKWMKLIEQIARGVNLDEILVAERPHVAILDTEIGDAVPELIQQIKSALPGTKTILLSGFNDVECTRRAFASGVDGIVLKVQPSAVLIATIAHLTRQPKDDVLSIGIEAMHTTLGIPTHLPALTPKNHTPTRQLDGLTEREREVVRLIGEGLNNKDIAERLCISSITVRHHLTNIFDKLGVSSRQKLLLRAHQHGLVKPPASA